MYKDYFKEIFQTSKTIIIPGLGSFTKANETDSKINFNPYLKFNDGFLAGFIAKKQGVSIDEAGKSIADSVEKIQEALNQKGEALVLGLGILSKTSDGKIEFKVDDSTTTKPEEAKKVVPVVEEVKKVVVENKPVIEAPANEVKSVVNDVKEKSSETIKPVEIKAPEIPLAKVETKAHDVSVNAPKLTEVTNVVKDKKIDKSLKEDESKKNKLAKEEEAKKAKQLKSEKVAEAKKAKLEKEAEAKKAKEAAKLAKAQARGEKKKGKFPVWLMIVLALVIGGGTFTAIKWDMVKGWLGMTSHTKTEKPVAENTKTETKQEEPVVEEPATDSAIVTEEPVVTEEVKVEEPVVEEKAAPVNIQPVQTTNGNFHVICGNFQSQALADAMVAKLNAEGNQAVNLGNRGGFFMVSAGSFSTQEEANAKRAAISTAHPKAYIYNGM